MKKFFSFLTMAAVMTTACTNNSKSMAEARLKAYQDSVSLANDTAGLAQFQQWKAQNEIADPQEVEQDPQMAVAAAQPRSYAPARKPSTKKSSSVSRSTGGSSSSQSGNTAKAPAKKGWSKAAKGAAIGTAGGAVVGAVVNKRNRVVGGVVGGVLGGAAGYGLGRAKDKKDGRY